MKEKEFLQKLGDSMREIRKKRGLTQEEVAGRAGISQAHYTHVEGGRRPVSIKRLSKVANVLGCELSFKLREKPENNTKNSFC